MVFDQKLGSTPDSSGYNTAINTNSVNAGVPPPPNSNPQMAYV